MQAQFVLGLVMTLGVGLSIATSRLVDEVQLTSGMLLRHKVPEIEQFTAFESQLLLHQAALDNDFAYPAEHEHFHAVAEETSVRMRAHYPSVLRQITSPAELAALQREFGRLTTLDAQLRASLDDSRGSYETRRRLAEFNACTDAVRTVIAAGRKHLQSAVAESGRMAMERTTQIARLVHLYIGFALFSSMCLVYHVRARQRSEDKLAYLAARDQTTRLRNRWSFFRHIEDLMPKADGFHVLLVEPDRLERMVAGIGPVASDELVKLLAERTQKVADAYGAEAFRLGDGKFGLLLAGGSEPVSQIAAHIQRRLGEVLLIGDHEIVLSTSIGSALSTTEGDALAHVQQAEMALHLARQRGAAHVAYSHALDEKIRGNLALEGSLRHAIERGELELHYQPQQRLSDGGLVGFEALLRWRTGGAMVSPAEFIPLAEESGLIAAIGDWVIGQACRQARAWNADSRTPLTIAVNISPRQFSQPRFLERLRAQLAGSGVNPRHIELEITEGILMEHAAFSTELLANLRALGLKLAIDDFGTGYSSLAYLKRFPVHKLKIDQAFVRQLRAGGGDAEIVKAVISLGHNLGFAVIAEGVETGHQAGLLSGWGCDEIQGYHYGKPMPAAAAAHFIEREPQAALAAA